MNRTMENAGDLLRDDRFKSLKVEKQYVDGFKPDKKVVINLKAFLIRHLNKPKGVQFLLKRIGSIEGTLLTRIEVRN